MIKRVDDKIWKKINKESKKKLNAHIEDIYGKNKIEEEEYFHSSADESNMSNSDFGFSEDEEYIMLNIENEKKIIKFLDNHIFMI